MLTHCKDCNGHGYFVRGHYSEDEAFAGDCERCDGTGERAMVCNACCKSTDIDSVDADGEGYCHACNVAHFRSLARDRFRAALAVVALTEAAE